VASWNDGGPDTQIRPGELVCVECRLTSSGDARGWRAYLSIDDEIGAYCPACAEREFGEDET
jgi:hypothetical protein